MRSVALLVQLVLLLTYASLWSVEISDFNLPSQDANGWSQLSPSADSRLIYVDRTNGNDNSGAYHSVNDSEIGSNPREPVGAVMAFKTLAAAMNEMRTDYPDWILLKRGEYWEENLNLPTTNNARGRSPSERMVATSYGTTGARPELRTGMQRGINDQQMSNIAIVGIKFWAHTRDQTGPFLPASRQAQTTAMMLERLAFGFTRSAGDARQVQDVLIEDCVFRAYANNVLTGSSNEPITRLAFRRCHFLRNWDNARSQGMWHSGQDVAGNLGVLLIEGCLFDHNGWLGYHTTGSHTNHTNGQATYLNHNTYMSGARNVILTENIFMRPSSIHNKWTGSVSNPADGVYIKNNIYVEGELGISAGGNSSGANRFKGFRVHDNIFTDIGRDNPTRRSLAWYMEINDWDGGSVNNNYFLHQRKQTNGNTFAMNIKDNDGNIRNVTIQNNVVHNVYSSSYLVKFTNTNKTQNMTFEDNIISGDELASFSGNSSPYDFSANRYLSNLANPFRFNNSDQNLNAWTNSIGENNAESDELPWIDPDRDFEEYFENQGHSVNTVTDALAILEAQSYHNWDPNLKASVINDWIREGFSTSTAQRIITMMYINNNYSWTANTPANATIEDDDDDQTTTIRLLSSQTAELEPIQTTIQ